MIMVMIIMTMIIMTSFSKRIQDLIVTKKRFRGVVGLEGVNEGFRVQNNRVFRMEISGLNIWQATQDTGHHADRVRKRYENNIFSCVTLF